MPLAAQPNYLPVGRNLSRVEDRLLSTKGWIDLGEFRLAVLPIGAKRAVEDGSLCTARSCLGRYGAQLAVPGLGRAHRGPVQDRKGPLTWEPPIGIEPMTYALRVRRSDRLS